MTKTPTGEQKTTTGRATRVSTGPINVGYLAKLHALAAYGLASMHT
jgi:hypothetical protein